MDLLWRRAKDLSPAARVYNGTPWRLGTVLLNFVLALVSRAVRCSIAGKVVWRRAKGFKYAFRSIQEVNLLLDCLKQRVMYLALTGIRIRFSSGTEN
jgi:hypothetical protein